MPEKLATNDSDAAPDESPPSLESMGFVDFPHRRSVTSKVLRMVLYSMLVLFLTVVLAIAIVTAIDNPILWSLVAVVFAFGVWLGVSLARSDERRIRSIVSAKSAMSPLETLSAIYPDSGTQVPYQLTQLAPRFVSPVWFGTSVRICEPAYAVHFTPLDELFEPVPLNESDPYFVGLEEKTDRAGGVPMTELADRDPHATEQRSALSRNIRFGGGWIALVFFWSMFLLAAWEFYWDRDFRPQLVCFGIGAFGSLFGFGGRGAWTSGRKWSLLPGAVMIEKTKWSNSTITKTAFRRTNGVLLVHQSTKNLWSVYVADATGSATTRTTPREALMLLRAWLSPVPEETTQRLIAAAQSA